MNDVIYLLCCLKSNDYDKKAQEKMTVIDKQGEDTAKTRDAFLSEGAP